MTVADGASAVVQEAGPTMTIEAGMWHLDAAVIDRMDASPAALPDTGARIDASPAEDALPTDAPSPPDAPSVDAASIAEAPTVQQVAAIFETRCGGGCHGHQGSDGFVFDGQLRTTLLGPVEAALTPEGEPFGAAACRMERRITPGDPASSYLLRKIELGLGRVPSPAVCGAGMPISAILDGSERDALALDYERLRLWIAGGARLE